MRGLGLVWFGTVAMVGVVQPATADVKAYCEAYAIDFATGSETDEARWQLRREEALAACLLQYQDAPVVANRPRQKPVKPFKPAQKALEPDVAKVEQPETTETTAAAAPKKPNIKDGTPEWYDYCARKYTSFNRKTGTYTSKTGVERKCLVTADFQ